MRIGDWELHPACVLLPALSPEEYRELKSSIEELGQLEKVVRWTHDGSVLDGRHRLLACLELGLEPQFEDCDTPDPWPYVWAKNIDRRHVEPGRRAALRVMYDRGMAEVLRAARAEAAERKRAKLRRGPAKAAAAPLDEIVPAEAEPVLEHMAPWVEVDFPPEPVRATLPERITESGKRPRDLLAEAAGCSPRTAQKVIQILDRPDLLEQICDNQKTLEQAVREARRPADSDWAVHEAYYTPAWPIELLAASGYLGVVIGLAVDPCVGGGAIPLALGDLVKLWITGDVREVEPVHDGLHMSFSWLDGEPKKRLSRQQLKRLREAEVVITNPIFTRAQEVVEAAWELCPHADVWIMQRRTWHDQARAAWFQKHQPDELNIAPRIRFTWPDGSPVADGGTDNTIHTWFGFSPGHRQPCPGPNGGITRTLIRPDLKVE